MSFRLSISLTLLTVLSLPAQAVPTHSQISYIAQRICELPEQEVVRDVEINPENIETAQRSLPEVNAIYYQEIGKLLDNGNLLPIEFDNDDVMEAIENRLLQEIYAKCQRRLIFTNDSDSE